MYIHRFRVKNYMIHRDTTIELSPITVLVGPQGGGKSALFDSMINFSLVSRGNVRQAFGPYPFSFRQSRYRGAGTATTISFEVEFSQASDDSEIFNYQIGYRQTSSHETQPLFTITREILSRKSGDDAIFDRSDPEEYAISKYLHAEGDRSLFASLRLAISSGSYQPEADIEYLTRHVSQFNKFRLDPLALASTSRRPEIAVDNGTTLTPRIGYHGEDLAATLYYLDETQHSSMEQIRSRMKELIPEFEGFEFSSVGTDKIAFAVKYTDERGVIPSARLSSGTLVFLGLVVLVSSPNRPSVLMIEEPENGLTPQAVKLFYQSLRELALNEDASNRSQVLISSHSPFVICEAWNGDDRDFIHQVKVQDGKSRLRPFSEVAEEQHIHLRKDPSGERTELGLRQAELIMAGYLS